MSDVWSFGILMFEVLSIGEMPYRSVKMADYKKRLKTEWELYHSQGRKTPTHRCLRCHPPENLPLFSMPDSEFEEAIKVMSSCWDIEPSARLDFTTLLQQLDSLVNNLYEDTEVPLES